MASFVASSSTTLAILPCTSRIRRRSRIRSTPQILCLSAVNSPVVDGLRLVQKLPLMKATEQRSSQFLGRYKTKISCSTLTQPETLETVQTIISKQLSIDESTVTPQTKFADLRADSLDTVEIMMALEEAFGVSIGEGGAENISTVQDAADLIEKVKVASK